MNGALRSEAAWRWHCHDSDSAWQSRSTAAGPGCRPPAPSWPLQRSAGVSPAPRDNRLGSCAAARDRLGLGGLGSCEARARARAGLPHQCAGTARAARPPLAGVADPCQWPALTAGVAAGLPGPGPSTSFRSHESVPPWSAATLTGNADSDLVPWRIIQVASDRFRLRGPGPVTIRVQCSIRPGAAPAYSAVHPGSTLATGRPCVPGRLGRIQAWVQSYLTI